MNGFKDKIYGLDLNRCENFEKDIVNILERHGIIGSSNRIIAIDIVTKYLKYEGESIRRVKQYYSEKNREDRDCDLD